MNVCMNYLNNRLKNKNTFYFICKNEWYYSKLTHYKLKNKKYHHKNAEK